MKPSIRWTYHFTMVTRESNIGLHFASKVVEVLTRMASRSLTQVHYSSTSQM